MRDYYVYILLCWDGSYYVGVTSNLEQRIAEHQAGLDPTCYTKTRRPVRLMFAEPFATPYEAIAAEKKLKSWTRAKKRRLIQGGWRAVSRAREAQTAR